MLSRDYRDRWWASTRFPSEHALPAVTPETGKVFKSFKGFPNRFMPVIRAKSHIITLRALDQKVCIDYPVIIPLKMGSDCGFRILFQFGSLGSINGGDLSNAPSQALDIALHVFYWDNTLPKFVYPRPDPRKPVRRHTDMTAKESAI